ncbi:MAG: ATP synthase F1 subunit epsilon [Thermoanaerobaculia bacterium]
MAEATRIPATLLLTVVTRERKVLEVEADEVLIPAAKGYMGILPGHTPLLASLRVGELMYRVGERSHYLVAKFGFAEILPNRVIVLAEDAYELEHIDVDAAEREKLDAERELASLASHDEGFALAQAKLDESITRIQVAGRR